MLEIYIDKVILILFFMYRILDSFSHAFSRFDYPESLMISLTLLYVWKINMPILKRGSPHLYLLKYGTLYPFYGLVAGDTMYQKLDIGELSL